MVASSREEEQSGGAGVTVEQFVALAQSLVQDPKLYGTLSAVIDKLQVAKRQRWTGKLEIDIQTGEVRGGPTIKAV
jgi:hypothetical protein